jgi:agmatine deiminase
MQTESTSSSFNKLPFVQPAEWESHSACWLAWPSHENLWEENLTPTRKEFIALCRGIADFDAKLGTQAGERLEILVPDDTQEALAREALAGLSVRFHRIPFGDIWLRDTGPIFVRDVKGSVVPSRFAFNGWGEKYILPHDVEVSQKISGAFGKDSRAFPWILEGGAIEVDGEGTCLTTEQCLLNPNRKAGANREGIEKRLGEALGIRKVIWLREGLVNDHTDGHIDTLARFSKPGTVICMEPESKDDPNFAALTEIITTLESATDVRGNRLRVVRVPSPGTIRDEDGRIMAASYTNFYIANSTVVVPTYGSPFDAKAVEIIGKEFPTRKVIGLSAKAILNGGGAFHCITQQVPNDALNSPSSPVK